MAFPSLASFDDGEFPVFRDRSVGPSAPASPAGTSAGSSAPEQFSLQWSRAQVSVRAYLASRLFEQSAVDDCLQEVALVAWKKGPEACDDRGFLAWCIACAKRIAANEIRRKTRSRLQLLPSDLLDDLADAVAEAELRDPQESAFRVAALRQCLEKLPPRHRSILEARYASGTPEELKRQAARMHKSMDAIYKCLERLRTALRSCVLDAMAGEK